MSVPRAAYVYARQADNPLTGAQSPSNMSWMNTYGMNMIMLKFTADDHTVSIEGDAKTGSQFLTSYMAHTNASTVVPWPIFNYYNLTALSNHSTSTVNQGTRRYTPLTADGFTRAVINAGKMPAVPCPLDSTYMHYIFNTRFKEAYTADSCTRMIIDPELYHEPVDGWHPAHYYSDPCACVYCTNEYWNGINSSTATEPHLTIGEDATDIAMSSPEIIPDVSINNTDIPSRAALLEFQKNYVRGLFVGELSGHSISTWGCFRLFLSTPTSDWWTEKLILTLNSLGILSHCFTESTYRYGKSVYSTVQDEGVDVVWPHGGYQFKYWTPLNLLYDVNKLCNTYSSHSVGYFIFTPYSFTISNPSDAYALSGTSASYKNIMLSLATNVIPPVGGSGGGRHLSDS